MNKEQEQLNVRNLDDRELAHLYRDHPMWLVRELCERLSQRANGFRLVCAGGHDRQTLVL